MDQFINSAYTMDYMDAMPKLIDELVQQSAVDIEKTYTKLMENFHKEVEEIKSGKKSLQSIG